MRKRILSLLLAFLMVFSMIPAQTFATDTTEAATEIPTPTETITIDNCSYCEDTLAEDGSVIHTEICTAAYVYDGTADVGKYVKLIEAVGSCEVCDGSNFSDSMQFFYDEFTEGTIMCITNWYWDADTTGLWYAVSFYSGGIAESAAEYWPETAWVLYDYTDTTYEYDAAFEFVAPCAVCGKPHCSTEHIKCDICGDYDCDAVHIYCEVCDKYGCDQTHLFCLACEKYDCTITHTFCGYCNAYDCGTDHLGMNKPAEIPVIPADPTLTEGADVSIVDEAGAPVTDDGLVLSHGMRISLSAWSEFESVTYQWQVRYDAVNDLWIDIQGQNGKGILVSPAMFLSIIEDQGSTAIRCVVTSGGETIVSDAIPVSIVEAVSPASFALRSGAVSLAETENPDDLEKSYVVVQYVYADGRTAAASDFAEIVPGSAYSHSYHLPEIPGYKATLNTHSYGTSAQIVDNALVMNFAENVLTGEYTIFTVTYVPDYVNFTVIHYWQNVGDDYYTEHERETVSTKYKTGDLITEAHKTYPGFYNLLYETPTAAADGSTVIEVYYDRYYYLMTFDLGENGYGVDPVYARYGDNLEIGTPTRAGYTFLGWKLNGEGDTIAAADMPSTMPSENREYVAQWQAAETAKVSVVIWGENPDDEKYSYQKTIEITAKPGETISWDTLKYDCGYTAHTHSVENGCYDLNCDEVPHNHAGCNLICGLTVHTHSTTCCTKASEIHTLAKACYGNVVGDEFSRSISEHWVEGTETNGSIGQSYYTYIIGSTGTGNKYIYIDGTWYKYTGSVAIGGTASMTCNGMHSHADHTCTYCSLPEHNAHTDDCYDCGIPANDHEHTVAGCYDLICDRTPHTHTSDCEVDTEVMDADLWTFVSSDTVTVDASGSTVMNVYYDRKTFTLTFKVGSTIVKTISDKWGADIHSQFPIQGDNGTDYKGAEWKVPSGCVNFESGTNVLSIDIMPPENITFTRNSQSDDATLYYYIEVLSEDECTREYNGRHYKLYKTVYLPNSGRLTESEEFHDIAGFTKGDYYPSGIFSSVEEEMWLYYTRNSYAIEFYNPTDLIKKMQGIDYQANLGSYYWEPSSSDAPDIYEPGSVQFAGWYLNPEGTGTEFDFTTNTMPSGPNNANGETALALYAKWEPVEYKVNYYLTKDSLNRNENIPTEMARLVQEAITAGTITEAPATDPYTTVFAEVSVKHGAYIPNPSTPGVATGYETFHPRTGYDFVGWFYLDEAGEEAAFKPENMPVMQDLNLYAKWSSNKLCKYNVYFALDVKNNETGAAGPDGVADVDETGNIIYVADPVTGSGIAGRTYTFAAKGGEELYDPEGDITYREGYFPTVGSHSIVIDIADEQGTGANSFTFLYQEKQAVPYTVKYLEKDTNTELYATKTVSDNKNVVVTENFVYIQGYMPDDYQKTLVVTAGGTNEIIFYYTNDEEHALYVVNYYIQELNDDLSHKGWAKYTDLQSTGDIGTTYTADAITIDGFTLSAEYTDDYNVTQKINGMDGTTLPTTPISALSDGKLSGELSDKGMELNFYYTRNLYPYEFRYMLNGTTTKLADTEVGLAGYDTIVTGVAKEIVMDLDGDGIYEDYRLYDPTETTKDIHINTDGDPLTAGTEVSEGQATVNVATFYYVRCTQTMTVKKEVEDKSSKSDPDPEQEFRFSLLIHSTSGYHRNSYTYTKSDGTAGTLEPVVSAPNTLQFTLKAGQTITIEGLPTAEYTVTELNLPTGFYDTAGTNERYKLTVDSQLDLKVTNTYDPANLTIKKVVEVVEDNDNTPEVESFQFTVTFPTNITPAGSYSYTVGNETKTASVTDGKMVISLAKGQTATFLNLPVGMYTVTEEDYSVYGYSSNYKVGDADYTEGRIADVILIEGTTQAVIFKNEFPVGDLTIEKTVNKQFFGTAWNGDDTFTFTVERTTKYRPLLENNQYKVLIDGVEQKARVVVDANGKLTVTIPFSKEDAEKLTSADSSVKHTLVIKNLPAGTYTVTEDAKEGYTQSAVAVDNLSIPAESVTASFINTVKRGTGDLYLEKEMEVLTGYNPPEDVIKFVFTIELLEGIPEDHSYDIFYKNESGNAVASFTDNTDVPETVTMTNGKITVELEKDMNITIEDLPEGKYRITEATIPYYANAFAHKENGSWIVQPSTTTTDGQMYTEIGVANSKTSEVKCTNTYPVDKAELIIQKVVTKEYERDTLQDISFTFTVTLAEDDVSSYAYKIYNADGTLAKEDTASVENKKFSVELKAGQYAVIPGMPVCGYTVSENVDTTDYNASYTVYVYETGEAASTSVNTSGAVNASDKDVSVSRTFSAGKTDAVVFTNEYKRHLGTLTISKKVNGGSEGDTFIFHITGNGVDMDVTITGSGSVTIYDLPLGTYTVTEDTDWSWRYTADKTTESVNLATNPDAVVTFMNTYNNSQWLNYAAEMPNTFGNTLGRKKEENEGS